MFAQILFSIRTHGAKILWARTLGINRKTINRSKYPWVLYFELEPTEFGNFRFFTPDGKNQIIAVRGRSRKALMRLVRVTGIDKRTDLTRMSITHPNDGVETLVPKADHRRGGLV